MAPRGPAGRRERLPRVDVLSRASHHSRPHSARARGGADPGARRRRALAGSAVAPPAPAIVPDVAAALADVSPARLRATDTRLVDFGTRNLFSERTASPTRGVFAARDWLAGQFRDAGRAGGGRLAVSYDTYDQAREEGIPRAVTVSSVIATLPGDDPSRGTIVISSHYDSRDSHGNDPIKDASGADDNGSGTSAVVEAARVLAGRHFPATIVFACFDGEEQGLYGSDHFAKSLVARGTRVEALLNDDIVGASVGHDGESEPGVVRVFSEALPVGAVPRRVDAAGTENDSPARELARFAKAVGEAYVPAMTVELVERADRFLRGGDQESFAAQGDPAIRYVEPHENFDHQHQDVRVEGGVQYGDLLRYVDFDYLARVTRLDVAALATLALAPAAPAPALDAKRLGYDSTLRWPAVPGAARYVAVWRRGGVPRTPCGRTAAISATRQTSRSRSRKTTGSSASTPWRLAGRAASRRSRRPFVKHRNVRRGRRSRARGRHRVR